VAIGCFIFLFQFQFDVENLTEVRKEYKKSTQNPERVISLAKKIK